MVYTMQENELERLLSEAAKQGAKMAIADFAVYNYADACRKLGMTYPTLQRRIKEGKIKQIDGKITGAEIAKYLRLI
ncbi:MULTISPECIES: hypothetical protein [Thorsellia]|uniref:Uncharacterized protein n=2 Tax=Thorsellia TaxID=336803 RepID=A0A1I0CBW4_9GAMM|nr:hypothetical protein [Thorsellia anophelis]SET16613.1 hypothetical protein SAMN02583745_01555 [Thorsellia anophelis DSM 18579]